jgi:3-hydroxyisobutyrate dehydrogenase-like beta-hydroxyacid dehydrogenase
MKIAFIGLGVIGFPVAGHLANAGYSVCVYNRTSSKSDLWRQNYNGMTAPTPATAAVDADVIFTCVGNDDDLLEVVSGREGILQSIKNHAVLIDHTTASAHMARSVSDSLKLHQAHFIDAPVSGGQQGADNAKLTVMCGGDEAVFSRVQPVMQTYAKQVTLMGGVGCGQLTKMVNQICIAGLIQSLAEAVHFAQNAGLDAEKVFDVISKGAAQSWQMDNRHKTMLEGQFDHGFAVDWMRKDLAICLDEARKNGSQLPVAALVDQFYAEVQKVGGGRWDTSSLLKLLK